MTQKRKIFIAGKNVDLGVMDKEMDLEKCLSWINNPDITEFLVIGIFPTTKNIEEEWFEKLGKDQKNIVFAVITKKGKMIGTVGLHKIDWISRIAEAGIMIGEKDQHSKGYGTEAENLLLSYAKNYLGLRKITGHIFSNNKASRKATEKNGFAE